MKKINLIYVIYNHKIHSAVPLRTDSPNRFSYSALLSP